MHLRQQMHKPLFRYIQWSFQVTGAGAGLYTRFRYMDMSPTQGPLHPYALEWYIKWDLEPMSPIEHPQCLAISHSSLYDLAVDS